MRDLVIGVLANSTVRTSSIGLKASSLQDEVTRCLYERDFRTVYGRLLLPRLDRRLVLVRQRAVMVEQRMLYGAERGKYSD